MKNYRFQNPHNKGSISRLHSKPQAAKIQKQVSSSNRSQLERDKKRMELQKEMKMLEQKIKDKDSAIKQTGKLLDIDDFLKKQKEKTKEYALKLNEEYQKQKKDREIKLYKKYGRQDANSQKLITGTIKSEIPLNIFTAIDQLKQENSNIEKWVLEGHHHKLDDLLIDKNSDLFGDSLKEQQQNCLKTSKENSWRRIKEVSTNETQIRYFPVKIEQNQLQPSDNCQAIMAALNLMPEQLSEYLYRQGQGVNKQIYFSLKFFPGAQARTVFTDQWVEVREFKHKYVNISSRHKNQLTFWSTIIDKSFRKLHLGQKILKNLNQTLLTVFGVDAQIVSFSNKNIIRENFSKVMKFLLSTTPKALIGFINDKSDTPDRIYPLKSVQTPTAGRKKKKGELIQELPSQQQQYNIINPYTTLLKSDFVNKFTLAQLSQYFNKIVIIRDYPERWGGNRIRVQFLSNGPISFTSSEWLKNNQYSFTLSKNVEVRIALRRAWGGVPEAQNTQEQKRNYGFILFRSNDGQTQVSCMKLQNLIGKCKRSDLNGAIFNKLLEKGTYVVIPFSHMVSQQYMQSFNLDILLEKEEAITINKAKIYQYYYDNKNTEGAKIVQKLQSRVKYERPKWEKIVPPKISLHSKKKGVQDQLESLGLVLKGESKLVEFAIPGKVHSFLVFGQNIEQKRQRRQVKSGQQQQIQRYEREQWLRTLLGYDSMAGEDINIGLMRELAEQTSDTHDFADFELTDEGFMALLETLMVLPRISTLKLDRNGLTDSSITYLCYYLQKGNRNQLKKLSLSGNRIGVSGVRALQGLKKRLVNLEITGVKV